jgi:hypothetical protein
VYREDRGIFIALEVYAAVIANNVEVGDSDIFAAVAHPGYEDIDNVRPLAINKCPDYVGRWEVDKPIRGLFAPRFSTTAGADEVKVLESEVQYHKGGHVTAYWKYWHYHWEPVYYREVGANMGSCLIAEQKTADFLREELKEELYLVGKFTILDKRDSFSDESATEVFMRVRADNISSGT